MLRLCGTSTRLCDGLARREFLRAGGVAVAGLTLPQLLGLRGAPAPGPTGRAKRCLQLFMWGGPSQLETFDLKPHAPGGLGGSFRPIATSVPGIRICEHLPLLAQRANRYAILRSVTHTGVNHGTSAYHMLTGHLHATPGTLRHPAPSDFPSVGCAVSRFGRQPTAVPAYVALPSVLHDGDGGEVPGQGAGLLGQRWVPFLVKGDPTRPDFSIDTLKLPSEVGNGRFRERVDLQSALGRRGEHLARLPA